MTNLSIPAKLPRILKAAAILAAAAALAALLLATAIPGALAQQDKPAAPSGFSVASGGEGEVVASWDAHPGANLKDYRIQWRPDGGAFKTLQDMSVNALTTSTSHTVTGLTAGTTYDFRLRARFTVGKQSDWTQILSAQAGAADAQDQGGSQGSDSQGSDQQRSNHIETPQNLAVEYLNYTSFKITWDSPTATDITHVKVRRTRPGQTDVTDTITEGGNVTILEIAPGQNFMVGIRFGTSATDFGPEATVGVSMVALPTVNGLRMKTLGIFASLLFMSQPGQTHPVKGVQAQSLSSDAKLTALSFTHSGGTATLSPAFNRNIFEYTSSVGNGVSEVTLGYTKSHSAATSEYLDGNGDPLADADTSEPGVQVALEVGPNVVWVEVTAENQFTKLNYMTTVYRLPLLTWSSDRYDVIEPAGLGPDVALEVQVNLSHAWHEEVSVVVYSEDITAHAGLDFVDFEETITFPPGSTIQTYDVIILETLYGGKYTVESTERLSMFMKDAVWATLGETRSSIYILDEDTTTLNTEVPEWVTEGESVPITVV